jgi:hypothetical protein
MSAAGTPSALAVRRAPARRRNGGAARAARRRAAAGGGAATAQHGRDAEVAQLGDAARAEQHVGGLHVAVQHAARVRVREGGRHGKEHVE